MSSSHRSAVMPAPGVLWGTYPERGRTAVPQPGVRRRTDVRAYHALVTETRRAADHWRALQPESLLGALAALRAQLRREGLTHGAITEGLACVATCLERTLGITLYDTQLYAAGVLLDGALAEMATGEGKTYAAAAAAAVAALGGVPVHVITANDYLVERDAAALQPFFASLGLRVGTIVAARAPGERGAAYACDIVYCTSRELVFDYLRDRELRGTRESELVRRAAALAGARSQPPLLRGLCMAIIDEADSVLLDDAAMPFILSREVANPAHRAFLWQSLTLARQLVHGADFSLEAGTMRATLTARGNERIAEVTRTLTGPWRNPVRREEAIAIALAALHLYRRDHEYVVTDGAVEIVDQVTGRAARGRVWSQGLQGLVELKEGCRVTAEMRTVAQITYQRFFPRYVMLSGMSGTLREARRELLATYGLPVVPVPLHRPDRRQRLPSRLFPDEAALQAAAVERTAELHRSGKPVLIGTTSVAASEALGAALERRGISHQVLNARQDKVEASIVARAGTLGAVTVSTNMAGRGTDIVLGPGVAKLGGLHVISCQQNASPRLDRQLEGRCARQGDPGSVETWLVWKRPAPAWAARRLATIPDWALRAANALRQMREERHQALQRRRVVDQDLEWERRCSFAPKKD